MRDVQLADGVYQDGGQFYLAGDWCDELLADFGDLVRSDDDIEGAKLARWRFVHQHPEYAWIVEVTIERRSR